MALLTAAQLIARLDNTSGRYDLCLNQLGTKTGSVVAGTVRNAANTEQLAVSAIADYEEEKDLNDVSQAEYNSSNVEGVIAILLTPKIAAINQHCYNRGSEVAASINSLVTALQYYGVSFTNLTTYSAAVVAQAALGAALPAAVVMGRGIVTSAPLGGNNPTVQVNTHGMGDNSIGGAFVLGASVNIAIESEVVPIIEVFTNFTGGAGAATIVLAGTDNTGATGSTWTGTIPQNTASAISTTLSAGVSAQVRSTVAVAAITGIVIGSRLTVDVGVLQETVFVENVSGSNITAVFQKAHLTGATVTGFYSVVTTPSPAGRRLRSLTASPGVQITANGHAAGGVRAIGVQDRVGV